jgi:hypothetical protein
MELLNATGMHAGYTIGMRPDGRELLVVVVKGTYRIPTDGTEPEIAEERFPIIEADTFTGAPGLSAPIYESDYAPTKPRCDVLLLGSAYAPHNRPVERVSVSLRIGQMQKEFNVVGNRFWISDMFGVKVSRPEPFQVMPISYDNAFGGMDDLNPDPNKHEAFLSNPIGKGFYPNSGAEQINGKALSNTEEVGNPVESPRGFYTPMGFGPIGRSWQLRREYAGTYDQKWVDNVFPFLPSDFDDRYYQCAPPDQQIGRLHGREQVTLINLTPQGHTEFSLPAIELPVTFYLRNYEEKEVNAAADTLIIEPDLNRFMIVWRASLPLRRNVFEVAQVIVGRMPRGWYRARSLGKIFYRSLKELVDVRQAERENVANTDGPSEEVEQTEA